MIDKTLIERLARVELARLGPHETLSTAELGARILAREIPYGITRSAMFAQLDKLGAHSRELCDLAPGEALKGFNRGKVVNRRVWHRIDSAAMPQTPERPSSGAASPASSLISRIDAIETWIAARDPLFRVL